MKNNQPQSNYYQTMSKKKNRYGKVRQTNGSDGGSTDGGASKH
jgi:hypothetical protein